MGGFNSRAAQPNLQKVGNQNRAVTFEKPMNYGIDKMVFQK